MDEIYSLKVVWLDMIIVTLLFKKEQEAGILIGKRAAGREFHYDVKKALMKSRRIKK
jgi:hypothetical protein